METADGGRRILLRVGLLIGSLALVLAIGEVVARLLLAEREPPRAVTGEALEEDLPELNGIFHLSRPNVRGVHKDVLFRTNSKGLRGPEYTAAPADGVFRIAITGDSVTMGSGTPEQRTYSLVLEQMLNAEGGDQRYEVINVGMGGINTKVAMDRLEMVLAAYRPDLVVYGFTLNDIEGPHYRRLPENDENVRAFWIQIAEISQSPSYLYRYVWSRLLALRSSLNPSLLSYTRELRENYFDNAEAWADVVAGVERFGELAAENGVCAQILIHTHLTTLDEEHPYLDVYDLIEMTARERGLSVTQSFPAFEGLRGESFWIYFFDPHPNDEGHAIMARALREGLAELPADCWDASQRERRLQTQGRRG